MAYQPWDPNDDPAISYLRKRAYGLTDPNLQVVDVAPQAPTFQRQYDQQQAIQPGELGQGDSEYWKGLRQGALGLQHDIYGGMKQLSRAVGADGVAKYFEEQQAAPQREMQAYAAPRIQRVEDVQNVSDLADYALGMLGQATPSMALTAATIPVGGAVGKLAGTITGGAMRTGINALTGEAAASAAARPALAAALKDYSARQAAFSTGGQLAAGELSSALPQIGDIGERGADVSPTAAIAGGLVAGALDVAPMMRGLNRLANEPAKGIFKNIGQQAFEEGITEGAQEVVARTAAGQQLFSDEALSAYLNNALGGAIGGAAMGGGIGAAGKVFGPKPASGPGAVDGGQDQRGVEPPGPPDPLAPLGEFQQAQDIVNAYSQGEHSDHSLANSALAYARQLANKLPDGPERDSAINWLNSASSWSTDLASGYRANQGTGQEFWGDASETPTPSAMRAATPDLAETSAFDQKYAAQQQAVQDEVDQGKVYGSKFHVSPSGKPYLEGEGLTGSAAELKRLQDSDPWHDYESVPYLTMVEHEADSRGLNGEERQAFIARRANELREKAKNSKHAPDPSLNDREYLSSPKFSVIMQSTRSPGGADYESGFMLNHRDLATVNPKTGKSLVHQDVAAAERGAQQSRSFQMDTTQGTAFVDDAADLTNTMMRRESGRINDEPDVVKRAATYFLNGLSALMANPSLQAKNFVIPDGTIIYREGKGGKEVRYGQIKHLVNPVKSAESAMQSIRADGMRLEQSIPEISNSYERDLARRQTGIFRLDNQIKRLKEQYRAAKQNDPQAAQEIKAKGMALEAERAKLVKEHEDTKQRYDATIEGLKGRVGNLKEQYKNMKGYHASLKNAQETIPFFDENGRMIAAEPRSPFPPGALNEQVAEQGTGIERGNAPPFRIGDEMLSTPSGQELPEAASDYAENTQTRPTEIKDRQSLEDELAQRATDIKSQLATAREEYLALQEEYIQEINIIDSPEQQQSPAKKADLKRRLQQLGARRKSLNESLAAVQAEQKRVMERARAAEMQGPKAEQKRVMERARAAEMQGPKPELYDTGSKYFAKDKAKWDKANKFIGRGSSQSSTAWYAASLRDRANTGRYSASDVVFVSAEGRRNNRVPPNFDEIGKAVAAGAKFITDDAANRGRSYNVGEREVAAFLKEKGYTETAPGEWTAPQRNPNEGLDQLDFSDVSQDVEEGIRAANKSFQLPLEKPDTTIPKSRWWQKAPSRGVDTKDQRIRGLIEKMGLSDLLLQDTDKVAWRIRSREIATQMVWQKLLSGADITRGAFYVEQNWRSQKDEVFGGEKEARRAAALSFFNKILNERSPTNSWKELAYSITQTLPSELDYAETEYGTPDVGTPSARQRASATWKGAPNKVGRAVIQNWDGSLNTNPSLADWMHEADARATESLREIHEDQMYDEDPAPMPSYAYTFAREAQRLALDRGFSVTPQQIQTAANWFQNEDRGKSSELDALLKANEGLDQRGPDVPDGVTPEQQQVVNDWVDEAQKKYEQRKDLYAKLQRYASKMAKLLGLTDILVISPDQYAQLYGIYGDTMGTFSQYMKRMSPSSRTYGTYHGIVDTPWAGKKNVIWLPPHGINGRNTARVLETLGHEIGHAVMHEYWQKASPQTKRLVTAAFEKWRRSLNVDGTLADVWRDKVGLHRADDVLSGVLDHVDLSTMTPEQFAYVTDFDEWFADQVSKWFQTAAAPLSEVDRFFKGIADTLKKLYDRMVLHGWKTTKEVDDFLNDIVAQKRSNEMFENAVRVVQQQRGWRAAVDYMRYLFTGKWPGVPQLPPIPQPADLRTDVNAKYPKGSSAKHEQALVKDAMKVLRMYNAVLSKISAKDGIELLRQMQVLLGKDGIKLAVGQEAQLGPNGKPLTKGDGLLGAFSVLLDKAEYAVLARAADTAAVRMQMEKLLGSDATLIEEIRSDPNVAIGYMYILQKAGLLKVGPETFNTFGVFTEKLNKFYEYFIGKTNDNARLAALLDGLQTEAILKRNLGGVWEMPMDKQNNVFQKTMQKSLDLYDGVQRHIVDKLIGGAYARMQESENPHLQWIARQFANTAYDFNAAKSWMRGVYDVMVKMNNELVDEVFGNKFQDKAYTSRVLEAMQNPDVRASETQEIKDTAAKLDAWFTKAFKYLESVGMVSKQDFRKNYFPWFFNPDAVQQKIDDGSWQQFIDQTKFDAAWTKLAESLTKRETRRRVYFMRKAHGTPDFLTFLNSDPQFRAAYLALPKTKTGAVNQTELKKIINDYVARSYKGVTVAEAKQEVTNRLASGEMGVAAADIRIHNPQLRFINARDINFLADAKASAQDRAFMASVMQKNIYTILHTYVRQSAKRGEYARRFGGDGEILEQRIAQARALGATKAEIDMAYKFIDSMLGTSGIDTKLWLDQQISKLPLPDAWKAKMTRGVVINPKLQNAMGWVMVYQNYRLLALATLSSIIDPLGISVRGSSAGLMIHGIRQAIRSTIDATQGNKDDLMQIAEMLGTIDRHMLRESIIAQYANNYVGEKQTKANDFLFRYNGLEAWTRWTRLAATASAMSFIKRHVLAPNKHSARYLQELGLKEGDVKFTKDGELKLLTTTERMSASADALAADGRVRDAVSRFVDQSIVRPNASQRPMWMNDPHVMLFGHLKSFLFGFYETTLKRAYSEAFEYGNIAPMLSLLMFIPVMFAGDALREWIQYGPRGAPWKRGWSVADHIQYETVRAGLTGRGEIVHNLERGLDKGGVIGGAVSYMGPTVQQLYDLPASRPNWKQDMVNALPLNNVYKHWFDRAPEKTKTQEDVEKLGQRVRNIEHTLKQQHAMI